MEQPESKKTIRIFALASFLNDFGSDIICPIWPLFVTTVLGASMSALGFIDGLGIAIVSISQALSGYISDRIRRRKIFIWFGYLFGSASRIGYALSTVWQHLIPFRILDRAGKIRASPRDAIVADVSTDENRGRNFGLLRTMDNLGAVCGIITTIVVLYLMGNNIIRKMFLVAALPSLVSVLLILFFIKETRPADTRIYRGIRLKDLNPGFRLFVTLSTIFALGDFSCSFLLMYAKYAGFKITFVPVLYLLFTAVASVSSLPFGKLSDKIGRKAVLAISFVLWGLACLNIIGLQGYWTVIVLFVLYGLHKGALEPVQRAFASELAPTEFRASALGGFQMAIGLSALPSSLVAGILWDKVGATAPFYLSFGLTFISMVLLMFLKAHARQEGTDKQR